MFCRNCGNQMNDDQKFCPMCGTAVVQNAPIECEVEQFSGDAQVVKPVSSNKKTYQIIAIVVACILVLVLVLCLAIPGDPKDLLMDNKWYSVENDRDQYMSGVILTFYSNGEAEKTVVKSHDFGQEWSVDYTKRPDWEVLEDNVLHYNGKYYEWETDWYVSSSELRIGNNTYTTEDQHGYESED